MSFSLNEIEGMAKKAARGAGYSWGMSEEAAKAARWLCACGIDRAKALACVLDAVDGSEMARLRPVALRGDWHAVSGSMCPLLAGATLWKSVRIWGSGAQHMQNVLAPVLLLPFAANAARSLGTNVCVRWDGALALTDGFVVSLDLAKGVEITDTAAHVEIKTGGEINQALPRKSRATPEPTDWAMLGRLHSALMPRQPKNPGLWGRVPG